MGEAASEREIDFEQLTDLIHERLRSLGELHVCVEILSARPCRAGGMQLELGSTAGLVLHGYLPGRSREKIEYALRAEKLSCDQVLQHGHEVVLGGTLQYVPEFNQVELIVAAVRPKFGVGLTALQREALRERLHDEGIQPQAPRRPFAPKRIGVVSGRQAAGLDDFQSALLRSPFAYEVHPELIPLFGPRAASECCSAIERLAATTDLIVLVRGDGAAGSFAMFDDEKVVRAVASCETPVLCAVGHDRNRSLADEFAYKSSISPSDAAHAVVAFSERDARELNTAAELAREAVFHAIAARRRGELKQLAMGFALTLLLFLILLGSEQAVLALALAVTLSAAAWCWLVWYRRQRARKERLVVPAVTSPGAAYEWLLGVPQSPLALDKHHLSKLQEIVESVRLHARRQM